MEFPYKDFSVQMVEWLEILRQQNVDRVFIYHLQIHPNVTKVLEDYVREGFVDLRHLPLPGDQPNAWGHQHLFITNHGRKRATELLLA